jgi:ketopantoate reductase
MIAFRQLSGGLFALFSSLAVRFQRCVTKGSYDISAGGCHVKNEAVPWILPDSAAARAVAALLARASVPAECDEHFTCKMIQKYLVNVSANMVSITCGNSPAPFLVDSESDCTEALSSCLRSQLRRHARVCADCRSHACGVLGGGRCA